MSDKSSELVEVGVVVATAHLAPMIKEPCLS